MLSIRHNCTYNVYAMHSIISSGSMEMEGVSPGNSSFLPSYNASRNVSVETNEQLRASSSLSSEEGGESSSGHNHRSLHIRSILKFKDCDSIDENRVK